MIKRINIIVVFLVFGCFYNMLALKGFMPGIETPIDRLDIIYDVSLALFGGAIIYLITTALPFYVKRKINRDIYKKSFGEFYKNSKNRLERFVDFKQSKENVIESFKNYEYSDTPKEGGRDNFHEVLLKIVSDKDKLYLDCIPYISAADDDTILKKIKNLATNPLFKEYKRAYLRNEINDLKKVEIGGLLKKFYDELIEVKKIIG